MTSERRRILFVDDEPAIIASLRNVFHKDRKRWDIVFATGGDQALDEVRKAHFDVVVSDMRMPGIDGAELLTQIKRESPTTVRVMLTGHADADAIVRAFPVLHRLLSKPCDSATLRKVLEDSLALAALPCDERIKAVIGRLDKLPSPPEIFDELARALVAPGASLHEVGSIVARDPAMSAKVLQLVGSTYFTLGNRAMSIEEAVGMLGAEPLRYIVLTASVFAPAQRDLVPGFSVAELQETSLACAREAERAIGAQHGDAFAAGLLHDVGRIVLALGAPDKYSTVLARHAAGEDLIAVEREVVGIGHAEVGAVLLQIWGLPSEIVEAVRAHHDPEAAPPEARALATAIRDWDRLRSEHEREGSRHRSDPCRDR